MLDGLSITYRYRENKTQEECIVLWNLKYLESDLSPPVVVASG